MKKFAGYFALACLALGMSACDNRPNVVGAWQGEMKQNEIDFQALYTVNIGFESNGNAAASILSSISEPVAQTDSIISPYQLNASATATMNGTWQYVQGKDDEIVITYNPSTLQVDIQPQAVMEQANLLTGAQDPQLQTMSTEKIGQLKDKLTSTIQSNGMNVTITHVKVHDYKLEFRFHGEDYTFVKPQE